MYTYGIMTHKDIETQVASYIAKNYTSAAEIGVGNNITAVSCLAHAGLEVFCTDIKKRSDYPGIRFVCHDITSEDTSPFKGVACLYSIRPGIEMVPALIHQAVAAGADLLIYHLGNEIYQNGGEIINCGVVIHRYVHRGRIIQNKAFKKDCGS